jgi:hypothetical protein
VPFSTEISAELFITLSKDADVFFANPFQEGSVLSKRDMASQHEDLGLFKAFGPEGTVILTDDLVWQDTGNLHLMALELASVFHPDLFPERRLEYFHILPD